MNTNVVLALDTRRVKSDGTYSVILRIVHHRESTQITLGVSLKEEHWDEKLREVKPSYKGTESVIRLNNRLQKRKTDALDIIGKLDDLKILDTYSIDDLKVAIERKSTKKKFLEFGYELEAEMRKAGRIGNARSYKSSLDALKKYCGKKDILFQKLNYTFLKEFEIEHFAKGNGVNGLAAYNRTYRAIYNEAIRRKLVMPELYPYKEYKIETAETRKRAIKVHAIKRIVIEPLQEGHPLFHTRNFFLLSYFARGMPFADMAELKVSDLIDGRIQYDRQKTGKPYDILIIPEIQLILDIYLKGKGPNDCILPVIKRESLEDRYKDVMWARKRYNNKLKKLATLCGIQANLTSYVSRHSFATQAKNIGVDVAAISEMLGHKSVKTTQIYLDSLPNDIIDDLHKKIIG